MSNKDFEDRFIHVICEIFFVLFGILTLALGAGFVVWVWKDAIRIS